MYIALAIAVEELKGKPEDIKLALNYAADAAQRTHNPNDLVKAADALFVKGYYERIGPLLDEAAAKVPHRYEPLAMSINLARMTKDPKRMGDSIERLLSLGWPGRDDYFRRESLKQAEELATRLREEARGKEADELLARLSAAEARDLFIRLTWDGDADYRPGHTRTSRRGSPILDAPNSLRRIDPQERLRQSPGGNLRVPRGDSMATIRFASPRSTPIPTNHQPSSLSRQSPTRERPTRKNRRSHSRPDDPQAKPVVVPLKGGRRKTVLPFLTPEAIVESWFVNPPGNPVDKPRKDQRRHAVAECAQGSAQR